MTDDGGDDRSIRKPVTTWAPILISVVALSVSIASYHDTQEWGHSSSS